MRASDDDRNAVARRLQAAVDEGRLDLSDYDERLRGIYQARTYGELEQFTADLPAPVPAPTPGKAEKKALAERKEMWDEWRSWLGGAIIMIGIWGAISLTSGQLGTFWPAIPLGIWAAVLLAGMVSGKSRGSG